jgi:hypothetical protein
METKWSASYPAPSGKETPVFNDRSPSTSMNIFEKRKMSSFCYESDTGSFNTCWICYPSSLKYMFLYENDMLIISCSSLTLSNGANVLGFHRFFSHTWHLWTSALCSSASFSILHIFILQIHYSRHIRLIPMAFLFLVSSNSQVCYCNSLTASSTTVQFWRLDHTWNM